MELSEVRREARETLEGKWSEGIGIVLAYFGICIMLFLIYATLDNKFELLARLLAFVVFGIISVPLNFGLAITFLKLKREKIVAISDFTNNTINNFAKSWKIFGAILRKMVPYIFKTVGVIAILMVLSVWLWNKFFIRSGLDEYGISLILVGLWFIALINIGITYLLFVSIKYSLTTYIAYDNENKSALEAANESSRLMKGNILKLILLELSFVGWAILSIYTCGIGTLWLIPYMQVAKACFYEKLAQTKVNEEETSIHEGTITEM